MLNQNFKRLIDLAKRTNSPLIVTNSDGEEPVVLMSIDQYESLAADFDPTEFDCCGEDDWYSDEMDEPVLQGHDISKMPADYEEIIPEDEIFNGEITPELSDDVNDVDENGTEEQFYLEPIE